MKNPRALFLLPVLILISLACSVPGVSSLMATDTPVPTNTLPPTLTPEPTATLEPSPLPEPSEEPSQEEISSQSDSGDEPVFVTLDNSFRIDEWDYIVGLVQNNSGTTIQWVEITVLLYNDKDELIATETAYPFLDLIPDGTTAPFTISSDQWADAATYDFLVGYEETDEQPAAGLEFTNYTSYSDDYYLNIIGEVHNNSDQPMSWVKVAAALYTVDGNLLNATYSYTMLDYLAPGETTPFKVWFGENWADGDNYEIQVQGQYDVMPEQVVELVDSTLTTEDGFCTVTGTVRNTGAQDVTYATVVVAFYDAENNILEAEWNFTNGDSIAAGGTDTFEITSYNCPDFDHYEVFVGN